MSGLLHVIVLCGCVLQDSLYWLLSNMLFGVGIFLTRCLSVCKVMFQDYCLMYKFCYYVMSFTVGSTCCFLAIGDSLGKSYPHVYLSVNVFNNFVLPLPGFEWLTGNLPFLEIVCLFAVIYMSSLLILFRTI